jgi:tetratricopeptide (TPR) repeat protein
LDLPKAGARSGSILKQRFYTQIVTRVVGVGAAGPGATRSRILLATLILLMCAIPGRTQDRKTQDTQREKLSSPQSAPKSGVPAAQPQPQILEQEPPEEDPDLKPTEYSFNPLEAQRNVTAGNFYFKKGNYRAASRRYAEATKWDPTSGDALLKLAEADEKLHDFNGARQAYEKFIEVSADAKAVEQVKKKLAKLPQAASEKK